VYDKFTQKMLEATQKLKVGHGAETGTTMGPLTTGRQVEKVEKHVSDAVSKGGKILCGGKRPSGLKNGYFFEPTIIAGMTPDMLTTQEEIFGPLLGIYKFETEEEAVELANNTSMGLASYFYTKDVSRTWRLLESLEAGMIGMNTGKHLLMRLQEILGLTDFKETHHAPSLLSAVSSLQAMARRPGRMLPLKSISSPRRGRSQSMVFPHLDQA
jgi:acyl-CoA reductase-like NAD-dependent aldehyde dehydrogenase